MKPSLPGSHLTLALVLAAFSTGIASATLVPTLDYTASADPDGGADGFWQDSVSPAGGHDFILDPGVTYDGSPGGAPSGVTAVYSFDGSGSRFNSRAAWDSGQNMENIPAGNPTTESATFEVVFRADTDTRQEILWEFGGSGRGASMTINNGVLQFAERNTDVLLTVPITANTFHHVVGVLDVDGDLASLYLDGAAPVTAEYTGTDWAGNDGGSDGALGGQLGNTVGGQNTNNGIGTYGSFDGDIAVFRLYKNQVAIQADVDTLFAATGLGGASSLTLAIAPAASAGDYDFSWNSQAGKVYDLVSALDPSTDPATWAVWDNRSNVASGGTSTSLPGVPGGGDAQRFFAVIEKDPPPAATE